jgi:hypothetical protein
MAIAPGSLTTRILVHDDTIPLLKARLPHSPQHPRAALALAEALTLWTNRPCRAALRWLRSAGALSASHHVGAMPSTG